MKTEAEIIEKLIDEAREYARQWANADAGKTIFELASALEASEARLLVAVALLKDIDACSDMHCDGCRFDIDRTLRGLGIEVGDAD